MTDVHDTPTRSYNMNQIKGKNTKPEMLVRKFLFANGFIFKMLNFKLLNFSNLNTMESIPVNWILVEEWENNYIFENTNRSFSVNVTFTEEFELPYDIGFSQLKGDFTLIGYENGAYSTNANTKAEALQKSFEMMLFIDSK